MARGLRRGVLDALLILVLSVQLRQIEFHRLPLRVLNLEGDRGIRPPAGPCFAGVDFEVMGLDSSSISIESGS